MRVRTLAVATAVGLVASLAPTVAAEAAAKPTYKVSISTSATKADVGQTIKVSGKVAGPLAAKKRLAVQVKVGKGAWKTVAKVRTTKTRRYAAKVKVRTAGAQSIRVLAPTSKRAKAGASRTRAFTGWRWLDLTTQPTQLAGESVVGPVTIAGRKYAKAITFTNAGRYYNVEGVCDTVRLGAGVKDGLETESSFVTLTTTGSAFSDTRTPVSPGAPAKTVRRVISGAELFAMGSGDSGPVTAVDPVVHCKVNRLAEAELPPL